MSGNIAFITKIITLLPRRRPSAAKLGGIKALLADCDGTLTDGGIYYLESGDSMKKFNSKDGMAAQLLKEAGFITGVVTGAGSRMVERRSAACGFTEVYQMVDDKLAAVRDVAARHGLSLGQIAFIGDDINDYEALKACGFSACPADAVPAVRRSVDYVCKAPGGYGAYREVADLLLDR